MTKDKIKPSLAVAKEAFLSDGEGLKALFRGVLHEVLETEMTQALGVAEGERSEARLGDRSGYMSAI